VARKAVEAVDSAIEWVNHPSQTSIALRVGFLFSEYSVVGAGAAYASSNYPLGVSIDLANRVGGGRFGIDVTRLSPKMHLGRLT
jgi:hypothetical protein